MLFYCKWTDVRSCVDDDYEHKKYSMHWLNKTKVSSSIFFRIMFLGHTFTSSPLRWMSKSSHSLYFAVRAFSFSFFLGSLSHKILLYALLHVIYNCCFQLHALRQNFQKLHKTFHWILNFNILKFLLSIFHSNFHNFHSKIQVNPLSHI